MSAAQPTYARRLAAEAVGTFFLLVSIVGPGILAMKAGATVAIAVLAVTTAVLATLMAMIFMFVSISGAHFNPCVTLMVAILGDLKWKDVPGYLVAQLVGGCVGVLVTNLMFDLPAVTFSTTARTGVGQWLGEFVATFGLFATIWATARLKPEVLPVAVPSYVFGAIWFTSSTCFANPAVTIARTLTDTLTGIRPADVPAFIAFQLLGAGAATFFFQWLIPPQVAEYVQSVVPAAPAEPSEPIQRKRTASGPLAPLE